MEETWEALFDESSPNWQKDADYNRYFLQAQQNYANHLLLTRGHVFLNEIYDALGLPRTRQGVIHGWIDPSIPIDFGLPEEDDYRTEIWLKFNVQGDISNKI